MQTVARQTVARQLRGQQRLPLCETLRCCSMVRCSCLPMPLNEDYLRSMHRDNSAFLPVVGSLGLSWRLATCGAVRAVLPCCCSSPTKQSVRTILSRPRGPRDVRTESATALAASMLNSLTSFFFELSLQGERCSTDVALGCCWQALCW